MSSSYRYIDVELRGETYCVRLRLRHMSEELLYDMTAELLSLVREDGCRRLALSFGNNPEYLYSVFLAKLITLQRVLREHGGELILCQVSPQLHTIFEVCKLEEQFRFVADFDAACA